MKNLKTYVATYPTRGEQTMLIRNCASAAEARKKLLEWNKGGNEPDVDPLDYGTTNHYIRSAKITEDKPRP